MLPDIGLTDKFTYDGDTCLEMYKGYLAGTETMDDFLRYLKRHVIMRVRKTYLRRTRREVCEDLVQEALIELWKAAEGHKFPVTNTATFHGFLNTIIRRRIAKAFAAVYDDAPKKMDPARYIQESVHRLPFSDEDELRLYRQDLPAVLTKRIMDKLRWKEDNIRGAAGYILEQILVYNEEAEPAWLKRQYQIADPKFLIDHLLVLIRTELYALREDITFHTNLEKKDILHEGLQDCLPGG